MRAIVILVATALSAWAAGCSADIAAGSYLCGSGELCPDDQVCDGSSNTCVFPTGSTEFTCPSPLTTMMLAPLTCNSPIQTLASCLGASTDRGDIVFDVPSTCGAVEADARVSFPVAFDGISLTLAADVDGSTVANDKNCVGASGAGEAQRCLTGVVTPGARYHLYVGLSATGNDCGGDCEFNRYSLSVQLDPP